MSELWGGHRVPVTLLGGYLGSGKTTLLNQLLARAERRYAVLVNDIGTVNVDAALVARRDGDALELSDGCVCCSLVDGFALAFERLRERRDPPDQVIVELSGVADPARVVPYSGTAGFRLDGVLVLFDLAEGPARERDRWSGDTVQRQLAGADVIVLTKRDLVDDAAFEAARQRVRELAPRTPIVLADRDESPLEWLSPAAHRLSRTEPAACDTSPLTSGWHGHRAVSFEVPESTSREALESWLLALPDPVVRVKGVVASRSGPLWVEGVGRRRGVREAPPGLAQSAVLGTVVVVATEALDPRTLEAPS